MRTNPRRRGHTTAPSPTIPRRPRLFLEALEDRTLPSVTAMLTNGILDIAFNANNDAATVSVLGSNVQVQAGGATSTFAAASVQSVNAHSDAGSNQSIKFSGGVTLSGPLTVTGLAGVDFSSATYRAAPVNVAAAGSIALEQSQLISSGDVTLTTAVTTTQATPGIANSSASAIAQITLTGSTLSGVNVALQATDTVQVTGQSNSGGDTQQDFRRLSATSQATVALAGASGIQASGNVLIQATASDSTTAQAQSKPTSSSASRDAAVAFATVDSTATATLSDQTSVTAGGSFQLTAANTTTLTAGADGSAGGSAAKGGSFAAAELSGTTRAGIDGNASVSAASVLISATSTNTVNSTAKSTQGGSTQNDSNTQATMQSNGAATSDGGINLAGAFALTSLNSRQTEAAITSAGLVSSTAPMQVTSSSTTTSSATADGSTTGSTSGGGSSTGVGVAVAIDKGAVRNSALLATKANLRAPAVTLQSLTPNANSFSAQATSGAGAQNVGVAGAFALNSVTDTGEASVRSGAVVNANGADLTLTTQHTTTTNAKAAPDTSGATGGKFGIGASVAINKLTDATHAQVEDAAQLTGAHSLTLSATSAHNATTDANVGASGGTALTPGAAIAVVSNDAEATLGSGSALNLTGALSATATETGNTKTTAEADATGSKVAAGLVLALTDATDSAVATTNRDLQVGLGVSFTAGALGTSDAEAKASAVGSSAGTANQQVNSQQQLGGSTKQAPSAETSAGQVGAAGAVGINLGTSQATASIGDNRSVNAGGLLSLNATNRASANASADATAVGSQSDTSGGPTVGVGVAVAINKASAVNDAIIGNNVTVAATGVSAQALMPGLRTPANLFTANATSGAGGKKVGVAGSLAINLVDNRSEALIDSAASVDARTGDLTLATADVSRSTASAAPAASGVTGGKLGIGASVALNIAHNTSHSEIEDGARLLGANNVTVRATGTPTLTTTAKGGAGSQSSTGADAITPVVGITVGDNLTQARVGSTPGAPATLTGSLLVLAAHTASTSTTATGDTDATQVGIGVSLALTEAGDAASATAASVSAGGAVTISATSSASSTTTATASARGGEASGGANSVDQKVNTEKTKADQTAGKTGTSAPSAQTADGPVLLAGAISINLATPSVLAQVEDSGSVQTGGLLLISAAHNADGTATADGSVVVAGSSGGPSVGIGAAVAIDKASLSTEASVGTSANVGAHGVTVQTTMLSSGGDTTHTFAAQATSGAGATNVGVAGALGLNIVSGTTQALVKSGAVVGAGAGGSADDVTVSAAVTTADNASATSKVSGKPSTGVGASVAVNVVANAVTASVLNLAAVNGANDLSLSATATHTLTTTTDAGAQGGTAVSPAVSLAVANNSALAAVGTGPALTLTGNLSAQTVQTDTVNTTGSGTAAGSGVAVGAAVGVGIVVDSSLVSTARNINAAGNVTLNAGGSIAADAESTASAKGGDKNVGDKTDSLSDKLQNFAKGFVSGTGSSLKDRLKSGIDSATGKTSQNAGTNTDDTLGVAAALSGNVLASDTEAAIGNQTTVTVGGAVTVSTAADTDGTANATGQAVSTSSDTSVAAAVGANVIDITNRATIGSFSHVTAGSITVQAGQPTGDAHDAKVQALAGSAAKQDGVAGSLGVNTVIDNTSAFATRLAVLTSAGDLTIGAQNDIRLQNVAGGAGVGKDKGVGAGIAVNVVVATTDASLGGSARADAAGQFTVSAAASVEPVDGSLPGDPGALAAGGELSGGSGVAGSATVNVFVDTTHAHIDNLAQVNKTPGAPAAANQGVTVKAEDDTVLDDRAGALNVSKALGFGGGIDVSVVSKDTQAFIAPAASVQAAGDVTVHAGSTEDVFSIAASASASESTGIAGAATVYVPVTTTKAFLDSGAIVQSGGNTTVEALHDTTIATIDGALGASTQSSFGISIATVVATDTTDAHVGSNAQVTAQGSAGVAVTATGSESVSPLAIGGAAAGTTGVAGAAIVSVLSETTTAHIDQGAQVTAASSVAGIGGVSAPSPSGVPHGSGGLWPSVAVTAGDSTTLFDIAGALAGVGVTGAGASADVGVITKHTQAYINTGATVNADLNVIVQATSQEDITSISAGAAGSGNVAIMGSAGVHSLNLTTQAVLGGDPTNTTTPTTAAHAHASGNVLVTANDANQMDVLSGSAGGAANDSFGASAAVLVVTKTTEASIAAGAVVVADALDGLAGITTNDGTFNVQFVAPAPSTRSFQTNTIISDNIGSITTTTGGAIGGIGTTTTIPGFSLVTDVRPPAIGSTDNNNDGENDFTDPIFTQVRTVAPRTTTFKGVAVVATSQDDVGTLAASGGAAGGFAVNLAAPVSAVSDTTRAFIDNGALVNADRTNAGSQQAVLVAAGDDYGTIAVGGAASGAGAVGVGPAGAVTLVNNNTQAFVGTAAQVNATTDVQVDAQAEENVLLVAAGLAASGAVSAAGSVAVLAVNNITRAFVGANSIIKAGRNVRVFAEDDTDVDAVSGGLGIGFAGLGVGISIGVVDITKDTAAFIAAGASVDGKANNLPPPPPVAIVPLPPRASPPDFVLTTPGVVVQARSSEDVLNIAAAGGAGGILGAAGAVSVEVLNSNTQARVDGGAHVNNDTQGVGAQQSVAIAASNRATVLAIAGGAAAGTGALAGGVDVGTIGNDVLATIAGSADVRAAQDVTVNAHSTRDIDSYAISGALGFVGVQGSVTAWSLGAPLTTTYTDASDSSQTGTPKDSTQSTSNGSADGLADGQTAGQATRLAQALNSYTGVSGAPPVNPTPTQRVDLAMNSAATGIATRAPRASDITHVLRNGPPVQVGQPPAGTSAIVADSASVTAGRNISIAVRDDATLKQTVGGAAFGFVALGGSVAIANINDTADAHVLGTLSAGGGITVSGRQVETVAANSLAGQGGLVGLGVSVVSVKDTSTQTAYLSGGANVPQATSLTLSATADQLFTATTGQADVGLVAAGASFITVIANPTTTAAVENGAQVGQTAGKTVGDVSITASSTISVTTTATAISVGLLSGQFNFARSETTPHISATISAAAVTAANDVSMQATGTGSTSSTTTGTSVAAVNVHLDQATAETDPHVGAGVDNATVTAGRDVNIGATATSNATATATSAAGSLVGGDLGANALAQARPNVDASINVGAELTGSVTAGRDVNITATSGGKAAGSASNDTLQLLGAGSATATANFFTDNSAGITTFDGGVAVSAGHNVNITATSSPQGDVTGTITGSSIANGADMTASTQVDPDTEATISSGALVTAGNQIVVKSVVSGSTARAHDVRADGAGLKAASSGRATAIFGGSAGPVQLARTEIGGVLQAPFVDIEAQITNPQSSTAVLADATTVDSALKANPISNATAIFASIADIVLDGSSSITGTSGVTLNAFHTGINTTATSFSDKKGLLGSAAASAVNSQLTQSRIDAAAGALVTTRSLLVEVETNPAVLNISAIQDDIPGATTPTQTPIRQISWDANVVILSAPDPELVLDASGNVVKQVGATFTTTPTGIVLDPIANNPGGSGSWIPIDFVASVTPVDFGPDVPGTILGSLGTITFVHTFDHMTISNASTKDLTLQGITVATSKQPTILIGAESDSSFSFNVAHSFGPTQLDVQNTTTAAAANLTLNGVIENPAGSTHLVTPGNLSAGAQGQIHTASLNLQTTQGSVGGLASRLPVQLVQSDLASAQLSATTGQDVHLDIKPLLRQVLSAGQAFTISVPTVQAGGSVDLVLEDGVNQTTQPQNPLLSTVIELVQLKSTTVIDHFRPLVERFTPIPLPPLAFFGTGTQPLDTTWNFGQVSAGGTMTVQGADTNTIFTAKGTLGVLGSGSVFLANLTGSGLALTGGPGNNPFSLVNWAGTVSIDGKAGTDTLALTGPFSGTVTALDPLTVVGSVATKASASPAFLNGSLVLSGDTVVNVADGATTQDLVINASVTGTGRLLKQGTGTLVLTGTSSVGIVLGGGTLAGTGTIGGISNTAGIASALSPGLPGLAGKLTVNGELGLGADVTLVEQLNGTTPNSGLNGFDQLDVRGAARFTNPTLQASLGFTSAVGDVFPIVLNDGTDRVAGTFNGLAEGATLLLNNQKFQISYRGGDGNDVALTHINTFALFPNRTITALVNEGGVATLRGDISDPDPLDSFTLNIDWGDGTPLESHTFAPGTPSVTLTHTYADDPRHHNSYTVALEWHDQHGGGNSGDLSLVVSNVPPTVSFTGPQTGVREQPLTFALAASDPSPTDQAVGFDYIIDWGDGSRVEKVDATPGNGAGLTLEHVFTHTRTFVVQVKAVDKDGGVSGIVTQVVVISAVVLEADPLSPGQTMLAVGGTDGDDTIRLRAASSGGIEVVIDGASQGVFHPTGRLVVYGGDGDDDLAVTAEVTAQTWLYGGAGDDRLQAGGGNAVLSGGAGDDVLTGGSGRDVMIGGDGSDQLFGRAGDDILIGGTTAFDANEAALAAVLAEWSSSRDYATRIANLNGTGSGPRLNGDTFLTTSGAGATVFDDGDSDVLSGGAGLDWFFAHLGRHGTDEVDGLRGNELVAALG